VLTILLLLQAGSFDPMDVTGVWWTKDRQSQVEIVREDGSVTGSIIWYENHREETAYDTKNPDEEQRGEEILGLELLEGFEPGDEAWRGGEIYDPTSGKSYRSTIRLEGPDTLAVEGCVTFICRTQEWERVGEGEVMRIDRQPRTKGSSGR